MKLEIGEKVIHKTHGAGIVVSIAEKTFNQDDGSIQFYILEIQDNGTTKKVFVPLDTANEKLRKPTTGLDRARLISRLKGDAPPLVVEHSTWNRRYRDYMEAVHSGEIEKIIEVYRTLQSLRTEKNLSFGERKLQDQCKMLIEAELEITL